MAAYHKQNLHTRLPHHDSCVCAGGINSPPNGNRVFGRGKEHQAVTDVNIRATSADSRADLGTLKLAELQALAGSLGIASLRVLRSARLLTSVTGGFLSPAEVLLALNGGELIPLSCCLRGCAGI